MNLRKPETSDVHLRSRLMRFSCVCAYLQSERDRERERERGLSSAGMYIQYIGMAFLVWLRVLAV